MSASGAAEPRRPRSARRLEAYGGDRPRIFDGTHERYI
jgi:hypothetical protein